MQGFGELVDGGAEGSGGLGEFGVKGFDAGLDVLETLDARRESVEAGEEFAVDCVGLKGLLLVLLRICRCLRMLHARHVGLWLWWCLRVALRYLLLLLLLLLPLLLLILQRWRLVDAWLVASHRVGG